LGCSDRRARDQDPVEAFAAGVEQRPLGQPLKTLAVARPLEQAERRASLPACKAQASSRVEAQLEAQLEQPLEQPGVEHAEVEQLCVEQPDVELPDMQLELPHLEL